MASVTLFTAVSYIKLLIQSDRVLSNETHVRNEGSSEEAPFNIGINAFEVFLSRQSFGVMYLDFV